MNLMLRAKRVKVSSPEVEHYMIDESRSLITVAEDVEEQNKMQVTLPLLAQDQNLPRPYSTLLVKGVDGYTPDGDSRTRAKNSCFCRGGGSDDQQSCGTCGKRPQIAERR